MTSPPSSTCTMCGSAVDATLLGGVCPRCLLGDVMAGPEDAKAGDFDGHELLAEIARGGMGVVYRARQLAPERMVALKTLRSASLDSPEAMARFKNEAEVMVALDHAAILPVYRSGAADGIPFFTMKLVEGGTLADGIDRYSGQWREIAELMAWVCDGVRHAHERGVLHRDLKPGNILFDSAGQAYVSDFGIAKLADSQSAGLTVTLSMIGTPHYLAPEVAAGSAKAASVSSDVWSLGVILYELLTAQKPFPGESVTQVLRALELGEAIAPRTLRADVPRDLEVIALKALAHEPARRYASAQALAEDLRAWLEDRPITARAVPLPERAWLWARRNPRLAGTAALLVLAVFAAVASLVWGFVRVKQENVRVVASQANERARLRESLLYQARAGRSAHEMGWRAAGLKALREAYAIRPGDDARDEAVAHLAGFDLEAGGRRFAGHVFPSPSMDRYVKVASKDEISVYRMDDDAELFRLPLPNNGSLIVQFDPRGRWLAVSNPEAGARVFSMDDHRQLASWPAASPQQPSEDGEYLPVGEKDRWVLWRTADWTVAGEIRSSHLGTALTNFQSRPRPGSQPLLVTGWIEGATRGLHVMDWRTGAKLRFIPFAGGPIAYGWVGDCLVVNCGNDLGQVFDLRRERSVLLPQFANGAFLSGSSNSVFMLSSELSGVTQFWYLPTGTKLARGRGLIVRQLATDDRRFLSVGRQGVAGTVAQPSCVRLLPDRQTSGVLLSNCKSVALSPDGRLLVIHDQSKAVVHDVGTGRLLAQPGQKGVIGAGFSPDGRELWLVHSQGVTVHKLTRQDANLVLVPDRELPLPKAGRALHSLFTPGRANLFLKMAGGAVYEWDAESAQWRQSLPLDKEELAAVRQRKAETMNICPRSRDGRWVGGFPTGTSSTIAASSAPVSRRNLGSRASVGRVSFSPDSKRLVFMDTYHRWEVFDAPAWHPVASSRNDEATMPNNVDAALEAAWSPDAAWFAVVCDGMDIDLVEAGTWRTIARLHGPLEMPVHSVNVAGDGSSLVVQRRGGPVEIWNLRKLEEEMRALGMDLRLPPAVTPPPSPPGLAGPFAELELPPVILKETPPGK